MVEDFLEQLSVAIPSTGAEDGLSKKMKTFKKLELRLTDRKKLSSDGYDCMICFIRPYLLPRGLRAFGTRSQFFPRGMGASITPFGRVRQNLLYPLADCSAQFFRVADLAHEALLDGLPTTKRYGYAG